MSVVERILNVVTVAILGWLFLAATVSLVYAFREPEWFLPAAVLNHLLLIFLTCGLSGLLAFRNPSIMCFFGTASLSCGLGDLRAKAAQRAMEPVAMNAVPALLRNPVFKGVITACGSVANHKR